MAIFNDFISLKDAAHISGYHSDYIGALIRSGKIHGRKVGNRWTVSENEVRAHFSKKHFVPASKVFLSRKTIIFGTLLVIVVLIFGAFFIEQGAASSPTPASDLNAITISNASANNASAHFQSANTPSGQIIIQQP